MDPNPPTAGDIALSQQQMQQRREDMRDAVLENVAHAIGILLERVGDRAAVDAANVLVRSVHALRVARGVTEIAGTRKKF